MKFENNRLVLKIIFLMCTCSAVRATTIRETFSNKPPARNFPQELFSADLNTVLSKVKVPVSEVKSEDDSAQKLVKHFFSILSKYDSEYHGRKPKLAFYRAHTTAGMAMWTIVDNLITKFKLKQVSSVVDPHSNHFKHAACDAIVKVDALRGLFDVSVRPAHYLNTVLTDYRKLPCSNEGTLYAAILETYEWLISSPVVFSQFIDPLQQYLTCLHRYTRMPSQAQNFSMSKYTLDYLSQEINGTIPILKYSCMNSPLRKFGLRGRQDVLDFLQVTFILKSLQCFFVFTRVVFHP